MALSHALERGAFARTLGLDRTKMKQHIRHSRIKKRRLSGFRKRNSTKAGRKTLSRRRRRGQALTAFG